MSDGSPKGAVQPARSHLALAELVMHRALLGVGLLHVCVFLYVTFSRIRYPFELEWMEGGSLDHILRILEGKPIYIEPTFEFTPYIYTPLYFWVCALLAKIFGAGFFVMRVVSLVSTIVCAVVLYGLARSGGCRRMNAAVAACIFLAFFKASGGWYDLARVDMLFLAFLFGSFWVSREAQGWSGYIGAALLAFLAFATKQSALGGAGAILTILIARDLRKGLAVSGLFLFLTAVFCAVLNWASEGWFWYYVFTLPAENPTNALGWKNVLYWEFLVPLRLGTIVVLLQLVNSFWSGTGGSGTGRRDAFEFLLFFLAMAVTAWMTRLHQGGYQNALIPFYAMMGLMMALALEHLGSRGESTSRLLFRCALQLILVFQFSALTYNPIQQIPSKSDRKAGEEWIRRIKETDGETLLVYAGYLARLAGKESPSPGLAYHVFLGQPKDKLDYMRKIAEGIRSRKYQLIITSEKWLYSENFRGFIVQLYDMDPTPPPGEDSFYPVAGSECRPEVMYRLKKDLPPYPELPQAPSVAPDPHSHNHDHDHHHD